MSDMFPRGLTSDELGKSRRARRRADVLVAVLVGILFAMAGLLGLVVVRSGNTLGRLRQVQTSNQQLQLQNHELLTDSLARLSDAEQKVSDLEAKISRLTTVSDAQRSDLARAQAQAASLAAQVSSEYQQLLAHGIRPVVVSGAAVPFIPVTPPAPTPAPAAPASTTTTTVRPGPGQDESCRVRVLTGCVLP